MISSDNIQNVFFPYEKESFIIKFFSFLDDNLISYAVLRNYDKLPFFDSNDLDLLIERKDESNIINFLVNTSDHILVGDIDYSENHYVFAINLTDSSYYTIKIDLFWNFRWRGLDFLFAKSMLESRVKKNNLFYHVDNASEVLLLLFKDVFGGGSINAKYYDRIIYLIKLDLSNFQNRIKSLDQKLSDVFVSQIMENDYENVKRTVLCYKRKLMFKDATSFFKYVINSFAIFKLLVKKYFSFPKIIAITGPDGVGKSTYASLLEEILSGLYKIKKFHIRPKYLPELKTGNSIAVPSAQNKSNGTLKKLLSFIFIYIYVIYFLVDYWAFFFAQMLSNKRNKIIIFDRYFYDFLIDSVYYDKLERVKFILAFLIPPTVISVFIVGEPKQIFLRKRELSFEEVELQIKRVQNLAKSIHNGLLLNSTEDRSSEMILKTLIALKTSNL